MLETQGVNNGVTVLRQEDFDARLPAAAVLDSLREAFAALARGGAIQPPQASGVIADQVDVIWYPFILGTQKLFGVKVSPYLMARKSGPKVTAWTLLCSTETGEPVLLCDSLALTTERTAATTALAVELLKPAGAHRLAVIGTGPVGLAHLRYASEVADWSEIGIYSRNLREDKSIFERIPESLRAKVKIADSAESAAANSEVIMLCTSSTSPVIDYHVLRPGQIVTSLTTTTGYAHEIAPAALSQCEVYCDYRATTPSVAGEMRIAAKEHGWSPESIRGDLPELISKCAQKPSGKAPIFFRSVGLGLEDAAIASLLIEKLGIPAGADAHEGKPA
jgi:L-arginine dehydrogenase